MVTVALFAAFNPEARKAATLVVGISIIEFLLVYGMAGAPKRQLRTIAVVNAVALLLLVFVTWRAWKEVR